MKIVIVGGVAAGPKTASRIVRLRPDARVTIVEKGEFLSYAGCGLPYYISGLVKEQKELMTTPAGSVRDCAFFDKVKDVTVFNRSEALDIDRKQHLVRVRRENGEETRLPYDKLVMATGAEPVRPPIPGHQLKGIYQLKGVEDAEGIKKTLEDRKARDVVIVGGGLIGVEVAEALTQTGCRVTIVELQKQILTMLDPEMAALVTRHFESHGVKVRCQTRVTGFGGDEAGNVAKVLTDGGELPADLVVMAVGVRPMVKLAREAGLEIGSTGAILVNDQMQTSDPDIFAVGDCAEKRDLITGKPSYVPLGSTANKEGRVAANAICGHPDRFPGILGSAICKVFEYNAARTGLSELEARTAGYDVMTVLSPSPDKPHFFPSAKVIFIKLVAEKSSRKILGVQIVGPGDAGRRTDIVAVALTAGMTVDQLANLDLTYAPPYSPAMDNIIAAANILRNKLDGIMDGISVADLKVMQQDASAPILLDVRSPEEWAGGSIPGAVHIPLGQLRQRVKELDPTRTIVCFCKISLRGYEAALILKQAGFSSVKVLEGGLLMWSQLS